jgi:hypothetical protein
MDFTLLLNIIQKGFKESCIYNLTGSSSALLLALYEEPYVAVETTEEKSEELAKDINFFREVLKKKTVTFLPEPDGLAGERAETIYSLEKDDSLVCSLNALRTPVWSRCEIEKMVLVLR